MMSFTRRADMSMTKDDLLALRLLHRLKQREIACVFGVTQGAWSFYENAGSGRAIPLTIQRAVTFFQALPYRRQRAYIRRMLFEYGDTARAELKTA